MEDEELINQYRMTYHMKQEFIDEIESDKFINSTVERKVEILSNILIKVLKRMD